MIPSNLRFPPNCPLIRTCSSFGDDVVHRTNPNHPEWSVAGDRICPRVLIDGGSDSEGLELTVASMAEDCWALKGPSIDGESHLAYDLDRLEVFLNGIGFAMRHKLTTPK